MTGLPDPRAEIRLLALRVLRGPSFWARRPIVRMDVAPGAYDEISSADAPGFTEALVAALPGLQEHRCSVGEPGGFVRRLRDGTYAPHIAEHVGLELQSSIGHQVGFGRARGGDGPGEYTVVLEHRHSVVGVRAAEMALEVVRRAYGGTLDGVEGEVEELRALAVDDDLRPLRGSVGCAVTGGGDLRRFRAELATRFGAGCPTVAAITPSFLLHAGLPYASSGVAVILDCDVTGVPARYAEAEMARRLLAVMADGVPPGGPVVVPDDAEELHALIRDAGRTVVPFAREGATAAAVEAASAQLREA